MEQAEGNLGMGAEKLGIAQAPQLQPAARQGNAEAIAERVQKAQGVMDGLV